ARNVAHVFNAWTRMPVLDEQIQLPEAFTADFTVVRALLRKGRPYEQAVQSFAPYEPLQQTNEGARDAMRRIAERSRKARKPALLPIPASFAAGACSHESPGMVDPLWDADPALGRRSHARGRGTGASRAPCLAGARRRQSVRRSALRRVPQQRSQVGETGPRHP